MASQYVDLPLSGSGGIVSITGTAPITANTAAGTTTIASTAAAAGVAGHITTAAQTFGSGAKTFPAAVYGTVVTLTDGATPALDAALGNTFVLASTQNPTIAVPTNPVNGQKITILFKATSADRTLALNSGTNGFKFGTDITALTATTSGTTDAIGCIYTTHASINKWIVVAYVKGFS